MSNLAQALLEVQKTLGPLEERGYNSHSKYNYSTELDVLMPAKHELNKQGVLLSFDIEEASSALLTTQGRNGTNTGTEAFVKVVAIVTHAETGEERRSVGYGATQDRTGDKALFKAITGGKKYALKNLLALGSTNDPEAYEPAEVKAEKQQKANKRKELLAAVKGLLRSIDKQKVEEIRDAATKATNFPGAAKADEQQLEKFLEKLKELKDANNE